MKGRCDFCPSPVQAWPTDPLERARLLAVAKEIEAGWTRASEWRRFKRQALSNDPLADIRFLKQQFHTGISNQQPQEAQ